MSCWRNLAHYKKVPVAKGDQAKSAFMTPMGKLLSVSEDAFWIKRGTYHLPTAMPSLMHNRCLQSIVEGTARETQSSKPSQKCQLAMEEGHHLGGQE
jgi:hypothetical protein